MRALVRQPPTSSAPWVPQQIHLLRRRKVCKRHNSCPLKRSKTLSSLVASTPAVSVESRKQLPWLPADKWSKASSNVSFGFDLSFVGRKIPHLRCDVELAAPNPESGVSCCVCFSSPIWCELCTQQLQGGAIRNDGGVMDFNAGGLFEGNRARGSGDGGVGGAIYNQDGGIIT